MTAAEYLRKVSDEMTDRYTGDCRVHAKRIAELLNAEGQSAWIARIHEAIEVDGGTFHAPLIPKRFPGTTWNTHYVACAGDEAWDPLAGRPLLLEAYAIEVFGRPLPIERWS